MDDGILKLAIMAAAAVYVWAGIEFCRARYADYIEELEEKD